MKTYTQNQQHLKDLAHYQEVISRIQDSLSSHTSNEASEVISGYFKDISDLIAEALEKEADESKADKKKTFNQYSPETAPIENLHRDVPPPENAQDLVTWTLKHQKDVADWCRQFAKNAEAEPTRRLFGHIGENVEALNKKLASDTRALIQDKNLS